MHRGLAIETSGRIGSVALVEEQTVVAEAQFPHGLRHAAEIVPMIDQLCRERGWAPGDLQEVYVSAGPGSFTGLRIGITLAKTLAFALQSNAPGARGGQSVGNQKLPGRSGSATRCVAAHVRLVAVPTVRVLVENAPPEARQVIIVLDARREQIFTARFERSAGGLPPFLSGRGWGRVRCPTSGASPSPSLSPKGERGRMLRADRWIEREPAHLDALSRMLERSPRPVHLLGEGIPYHQAHVPTDDAGIIITPAELWRARASAVAKVGIDLARRGEFADPFTLTPIYIRLPEAEEKWQAAGRE